MMPSRYTSQMSRDDAAAQAARLGVAYSVIPIEGMFEATLAAPRRAVRRPQARHHRREHPGAHPRRAADGHLQQDRPMLLTTGNKSEMAVGYATLYGDMNGGFAPIKDCSKMLVYRLAHWRNAQPARAG